MKNKTEICVPIRNEEELQQAKEILIMNGERIDELVFDFTKYMFYLQYSHVDNDWFIDFIESYHTEIPLSELESVLKGESVGNQSSIEWIESEIEKIPFNDPSVSDFYEDVLKILEQAKIKFES
jgi:hypothetical protein